MRTLLSIFLALGLLLPIAPLHAEETTADWFNPDYLLSDADLNDVHSMTLDDLQRLFSRGYLGTYETEDFYGVVRPASEIVWNAAQEFQLNPRFLAVLLQREQSLIEFQAPSQDRLDWAMGYAICDSCRKDDPRLQRFRGFGNQVHHAARQIRESYLADLDRRNATVSGIGVGREVTINGIPVVPRSQATAALYTYTPHLLGNRNFVRIWHRWFVPTYPSGSLLQDGSTGEVWYIHGDKRRPVTSRAALMSRFDGREPVSVSPAALDAYPIGPAISFPNYSLLRLPSGAVFLLVDDTLRGFASQEALRRMGFSPDEIVDVEPEELEGYLHGEPIRTGDEGARPVLMQDTTTGGVYAVQNGQKQPIVSRQLLQVRFPSFPIQPTAPETLAELPTGLPVSFPDGTLVLAEGSPDVYLISDGWRRHIVDEKAFLAYGWNWNHVIHTDTRSVNLHPQGPDLTAPSEASGFFQTASAPSDTL